MSAIAEIVLPQQNQVDSRPLAPVIPLIQPVRPEDHLDLVYAAVGRLRLVGNAYERGDLVSVGTVGLLEAARRYRSGAGVPFRLFAEVRIKGALLDALRVTDWVGRTIRNRLRLLKSTEHQMTQSLGRAPHADELAETMGISIEDLAALQTRATSPERFLEDYSKDGTSWEDLFTNKDQGALETLCERQKNEELQEVIAALPPREREVIQLSFFEEATLKDIGCKLGVTEARACQLRAQGLRRIKEALNKRSS
jgi:RNA polymerase sigma factor for flagellar operon FliA